MKIIQMYSFFVRRKKKRKSSKFIIFKMKAYGVIIMWGLDISSEREILSQLKEFRIKPSEEIEYGFKNIRISFYPIFISLLN